jgi:hypothetical protein
MASSGRQLTVQSREDTRRQVEQLVADAVENFVIQRHFAAGVVNHDHVAGRTFLPGRTFELQGH